LQTSAGWLQGQALGRPKHLQGSKLTFHTYPRWGLRQKTQLATHLHKLVSQEPQSNSVILFVVRGVKDIPSHEVRRGVMNSGHAAVPMALETFSLMQRNHSLMDAYPNHVSETSKKRDTLSKNKKVK
jgi:hypothetical protein